MCKKLLLVCLIQVTLARHIPDTRQYFQPPFNPEFYVRNPVSDYEVQRQDTQYRNADYTHRDPYINEGKEDSNHDQNSRYVDRTSIKVFQTGKETMNERAHYQIRHNNEGLELNNYDSIMIEIKPNIDSKSNVPKIYTNLESKYELRNINSDQENQRLRTNLGQGNNPNKDYEPTNPSILYTRNREEVNYNSGSSAFISQGNPGLYEIKTTSDNVFRYTQTTERQNGVGNDREVSGFTELPFKSTKKTLNNEKDLDDRGAFEADKCPRDYVKVNGTCIECEPKDLKSKRPTEEGTLECD